MKIKILSFFLAFLFASVLYSCSSKKKKVMIFGLGYSGNYVRIWHDNKLLFSKLISCRMNESEICYLNDKILLSSENTIQLRIQLDSAAIKIIDTAIFIPNRSKEPFISFIIPYQNQKRGVFVGDELDSAVMKD